MYKKILLGIIAFGLVSVVAMGIVSASPAKQESGDQDSFRLLVAVLSDARDKKPAFEHSERPVGGRVH